MSEKLDYRTLTRFKSLQFWNKSKLYLREKSCLSPETTDMFQESDFNKP